MLAVGRLIDRLGREPVTRCDVFWSVASMPTRPAARWQVLRGPWSLGFWEAGVFPASAKCVAEWFPQKKERWRMNIQRGTNLGQCLRHFSYRGWFSI